MLIERFLEGKDARYREMVLTVRSCIMEVHPAIEEAWKWNTLTFVINAKVVGYFSIKQGRFQVGFWQKEVLSSQLIHRDLKMIGYYLLDSLSEEVLADVSISAQETVAHHLMQGKN